MSLLRDYAAALAQPTIPLAFGDPRAVSEPAVRFDEVIASDNSLRAGWKGMAALAVELTPAELRRIDDEIAVMLADDGVSYGNPEAGSQPWRLDPLPLVLDAGAWAPLEVGLAQRTELLGALLRDLYGDQRLLAEGIIPAAAVFGHAGYVRALASPDAAEAHPLILAGADLGRDSAGDWHVLADRVQAPSGLGYAMTNRRVISRVLPELYEQAGLHRMEPYFSAVRHALLAAAAPGVDDPRVVVLSPGTHSETAYDQAFVASTLGFPLVQGEDLVVRDGWLWMKPSGFPQQQPHERVDVILRRVDAEWCDPLELRGGSRLGVAGLTEAVRRGRVRVVNGLGAGVLENPALLPFLPAACERLLGERLRLPSVPAWWCGEPDGRERVLRMLADDPASLIVRELDGRSAALDGVHPDELRARIDAAPHRYVGIQRLALSQAPAWGAAGRATGRAQPSQLLLRAFTVREGSSYRTLAGGMATLVGAAGLAPSTKDVWVLKAAPGDPDQGLVDIDSPAVTRAVPAVGPRALEDLFWVGRYVERVEDLLRLVLTASDHAEQLDYSSSDEGRATLAALVAVLHELCGTRWSEPHAELRSILLDHDRPGSAADALDRLRDALEGVRDQLSGDTWRAFGITDRAMDALRGTARIAQTADTAGRMLSGVLSLQGVTASMMRDEGWHVIELGRHLERALQLGTLLEAVTTLPERRGARRAVLGGVLLASESAVTHRRRYRGEPHPRGVIELLLDDAENPRSLRFALTQIGIHLAQLSASTGSTRPERLLEHLELAVEETSLRESASVEGLIARQPLGQAELSSALGEFLTDARAQLQQLADAIASLHFEGGPAPQPLSSLTVTELARAVS